MLGDMSQSLQPQPARTADDVRWFLTLVTVTLGGYLLVLSLSGQVTQILSGSELGLSFGASFGVLLVLQLLFALAVVLLGLFFAPTTLARRGVAGAIIVGVVVIVALAQALRFAVGFGAATTFIGFSFGDPFVMLSLALGAAWLVVRNRPGLAYVLLTLVILTGLVRWGLLYAGVDSATSQLIALLLSAAVTVAIGWGGVIADRLFSGSRRASTSGSPVAAGVPNPFTPQPVSTQQPVYTEQNDRPAERGPVI